MYIYSFSHSVTSSGLTSSDPAVVEVQNSDSEQQSPEQGSQQSSPQHKIGDSSPESKRILDENANTTQNKTDQMNVAIKVSETQTGETKQSPPKSSSSESSRESDDTVISVEGGEDKTQVKSQGQTIVNTDDQNDAAENGSPAKPADLQLNLTPAQSVQSKLSPISEGRESLSATPVTPIDQPSMSPRNKANLHIEVPRKSSLTRSDRSSPALPKTPSNTPDLPRKQVVTINEPKNIVPKSPSSDFSSYGELSPPFSPSEESSKTHVPKPRKTNLKGKLFNFHCKAFILHPI